MNSSITNDNRVPGCEHFTRPEDISRLSKYLKVVKEVSDSRLKLEQSPIDMNERLNPIVPEVSELPLSAVTPKNPPHESTESLTNVLEILEEAKINDPDQLPNYIPFLPDNSNNNFKPITSLPLELEKDNSIAIDNTIVDIEKLNTSASKIVDDRYLEVVSNSLSTKDKLFPEDVSIDRTLTKLNNVNDLNELKSSLDVLDTTNTSDISLSETLERLDIDSTKFTILEGKETVSKLTKLDEREITLSEETIAILDKTEYEISTNLVRPNIGTNDVDQLDKSAITILNTEDPHLDLKIDNVPNKDKDKEVLTGDFQLDVPSNRNPEETYHPFTTGNGVTIGNGNPISNDLSELLDKYRKDSVVENTTLLAGSRDRGLTASKESDVIQVVSNIIKDYKANGFKSIGRILDKYRNSDGELLEYEKKIESLLGSVWYRDEKSFKQHSKLFDERLKNITEIVKSTISSSGNGDIHHYVPDYKLGKRSWYNFLDASAYVRFIAEEACSSLGIHGSLKEIFLYETIALLVLARDTLQSKLGTYKSQLPGNSSDYLSILSGGISGDIKNTGKKLLEYAYNDITSAISNQPNRYAPINHPTAILKHSDGEGTSAWISANNRMDGNTVSKKDSTSTNVSNVLKSKKARNSTLAQVSLSDSYLSGSGIKTTLFDLCNVEPTEISSVEELYKAFKQSPYMTTPGKFTSSDSEGYNNFTLDSNCYWEIIFEPYLGDENGNRSFLPGLHEINVINLLEHGVNTNYNKWVPILSFDLQRSKLNGKSLGLYDGEIIYPVSIEYLNELRLTIADDQYKSWRRYFETCMDVAVFNSNIHNKTFYTQRINATSLDELKSPSSINDMLTIVDKSNQVVSMYKNLAFRCIIYIMTPQKSTIRKFDLLLSLKDFVTEYTGDVDSGGTDLTLSFSVIGENPRGDLLDDYLKKVEIYNDVVNIIQSDTNQDVISQKPDYSAISSPSNIAKILN